MKNRKLIFIGLVIICLIAFSISFVACKTNKCSDHKLIWTISGEVTDTETSVEIVGTCESCGGVETVTLPALKDSEAWTLESEKQPSCKVEGYLNYVSKEYEGISIQIVLEKSNHTYVFDNYVEATCLVEGTKAHYHCSECLDTFDLDKKPCNDLSIPKTDHNYGNLILEVPSTCLTNGTIAHYHCSECGKDFDKNKNEVSNLTLEKGDHIWGNLIAEVPSSCSVNGVVAHYHCSICDKDFDENKKLIADLSLPLAEHTLGDLILETPATCTSDGEIAHYTCDKCGKNFNENKEFVASLTIDKIDHTEKTIQGKPATCTESGLSDGAECLYCGLELKPQTTIPALGHSEDDGIVTTEPTCTEKGEKTYSCTVCGEVIRTEEIEASAHSEHTEVTKPATCTEKGVQIITCTACGEMLRTETIEKLGHSWGEPERQQSEICANSYILIYTCTRCGETKKVADGTDGHNVIDMEYVAPTCVSDGHEGGKICADCGTILEEPTVIPALGHTESTEGEVTKQPTCTETGVRTYTCTVCGEVLRTETIAKLGHYEGESKVTLQPTCTTEGVITYYCETCGEELRTESIPAKGHNYVDTVVAPTCTADGYTIHQCTVCDHNYTDTVVEKTGHDWNDGVVTTPATCTVKGEKTYTCNNCGETRKEELALLAHTEVEIPAKAPTCTESGYTAGVECAVCGTVIKATESIPAKGHNYVDTVVAPTCTEGGYTIHKCSDCDDECTDSKVDALGHDYKVTVTEATCGKAGEKVTTCSRCDYIDTEVIPATGNHTWDDGEIIKEPSTMAQGEKKLTCTVCGETKIVAIPALEKLTIKLIINDDTANAIELDDYYSDDENVLAQYSCTVTLSIGATVKLIDNKNNEYHNYEWNCPFQGTASLTGDHIFYVKIFENDHSIWVTEPEKEPDVPYQVLIVINGDTANPVIAEVFPSDKENVVAQYRAIFALNKNDTVVVTDTKGNVWDNYEGTSAFSGTASIDGHCTLYFKTYADGGDSIWATLDAHTGKIVIAGTPATCTVDGLTDKIGCSVCGKVLQEQTVILSTGHTEVTINGTPATCTKGGLTDGKKCSKCGEVLVEQTNIDALGHDWGEPEKIPSDICTSSFVLKYICARCGETKIVTDGTEGHTPVSIETVLATCTEDGHEGGKKCAVCGTIIEEPTVLPALGHELTTTVKEATCGEDGEKVTTCSRCDYTDTEVIPATGDHTWDEGEIIKEPTTMAQGEKKLTCTVCGASKIVAIPALEKLTITLIINDDTANAIELDDYYSDDENVLAQYYCTVTLSISDTVKLIDNKNNEYHNYEWNCPFQGTANLDGEHTIYVKIFENDHSIWVTEPEKEPDVPYQVLIVINGDTANAIIAEVFPSDKENVVAQYRAIFALNKNDTVVVTDTKGNVWDNYEGTSAFKGTASINGHCTLYFKTYVDGGNSIWASLENHTSKILVKGTAATCTADGLTDKIACSVCGKVLQEQTVIPSKGHTEVTVVGTPATCTKSGLTDGTKCSKCGEILVEQTKIDALGHDWGEPEKIQSDICTSSFVFKYTCARCGETKIVTDGTEGHKAALIEPEPATCTEDGHEGGKKCAVCGTIIEEPTVLPALGHDLTTTVKEATCGEDGEKVTTCSRCDYTDTEVIPATGNHTWDDGVVTKEPTTTSQGQKKFTCTICNATKTEVIPMLEALTVKLIVNNDEANAIILSDDFCDDENVLAQYSCTVTLSANDTVKIIDSKGIEYKNYESECNFKGTVTVSGEHTFFVKTYSDGGNSIWVNAPKFEIKLSINNDTINEAVFTKQEKVTETELSAQYILKVTLDKKDTVSIYDTTDNIYNSYESGCGFKGTALASGEHTFYVKFYKDGRKPTIWVTQPDVPYQVLIIINGDEDNPVVAEVFPSDKENVQIQYRAIFALNSGDTVVVTDTKGVEWVNYEPGTPFTGTATTDGDCTIYLKKYKGSGDSIWATLDAHTESVGISGTAATCTTEGTSDQIVCSVCGKVLQEQTVLPATGHSYGEWTIVTNATCTEAGSRAKTCANCDDVVTETITALGHDYATEFTVDKEATCTEEGSKSKHCSRCDSTTDVTVIPVKGHTEVTVNGKPATCTEDGLTDGTKCSVCNDVLVQQETIPQTGHTENQGVVTTEPSCTDKGERTFSCTVCGSVLRTEEIDALGHTEHIEITKNATCTEAGKKVVTCTVCEETLRTETIKKLDHSWDAGHKEQSPICQGSYVTIYTCTVCSTTKTVTDGTEGHTPVDIEKVEPTCTEDGHEGGKKCADCGTVLEEPTVLLHTGHKQATEGVVTKQPTCTDKGTKTYYCTVCNEPVKTENIKALGHDLQTSITQATCTADGEKVTTCSRCDYTSTEVLTATGHTYVDTVVPATCTTDGYTNHKCSACVHEYNDTVVEALGHAWNEGTVTTPATCTEDGILTQTCSKCNETQNVVIEATGHTYVDTVVPATCTEDGYTNHKCSVCDNEFNDTTVEATGHTYVDTVVAPTCTTDGYTNHKCSVCDNEFNDTTVEATGHSYVDTVVPPTCTEEGYTNHKCSACDSEYQDTIVEALGHTWNEGEVIKQPTTSAQGERKLTCTVCGATTIEAIPALEKLTVKLIVNGNTANAIVLDDCYSDDENVLQQFTCTVTLSINDTLKIVDDKNHEYVNYEKTCPFKGTVNVPGAHTFYVKVYSDGDAIWVDEPTNEIKLVINGDTTNEYVFTKQDKVTETWLSEQYILNVTLEKGDTVAISDTIGNIYGTYDNDCPFKGTARLSGEHTFYLKFYTDGGKSIYVAQPEVDFQVFIIINGDEENPILTEEFASDNSDVTVQYKAVFALNVGDKFVVMDVYGKDWSNYENGSFKGTANKNGHSILYFKKYTNGGDSIWASLENHTEKTITGTAPTCTESGLSDYKVCSVCGKVLVAQTTLDATGHSYGEWTIVTNATCTEAGSRNKTCATCGDVVTETVTALGHDYASEFTVDLEATCTVEGSKSKHCSRCDSTTEVTVIPANGHSYGEWEVTDDATCTEDGSRKKTCATCGDVVTETVTALGHDYASEFTVDSEATCTEAGSKSKHCSRCDSTSEVTVIDPLGHELTLVSLVEATCTEGGNTAYYTCSRCEKWYSDANGENEITDKTSVIVPATGHSYGEWEVTDATCLEAGSKTKTCENCNDVVTETITALGHDWADEFTVDLEATCTVVGSKSKHCSRCDEKSDVTEIPLAAHTEVEIPAKAATCTLPGNTAGIKCSVCSAIIKATKAIPATGHTERTIPAVDPTCTEDGHTAGIECSVCNTVLTATEVIEATGHTEQVIKGKAATCIKTGLTDGKKCTVCGTITVEQNAIPVIEHDQNGVIEAVEPTCTQKGYTDGKKCSMCGKTMVEPDEISATGHSWDAGTVTKNATCTAKGEKTFECSKCDATKAEPIAMLPHEYGEGTVKTPATCTTAGTMTYKCNNCTNTKNESIPATGHTEVVLPAVAATCTATGLTEGKQCSVCHEITLEQIEIPKIAHNEVEIPAKAATCTATGLTAGKKCSVCGKVTLAQQNISKIPHTEEIIQGKAATCTEPGLTDGKKCSVCKTIYEQQEEIEPLGHDWVDPHEETSEICSSSTVLVYNCSRCNETKTVMTSTSGHDVVAIDPIPATCTKSGQEGGTKCKDCGTIIEEPTIIKALGHSWNDGVVTSQPTCTEKGVKTFTCTRDNCGATYIVYIDALDHEQDEGTITKQPSCTEHGIITYHCTRCEIELGSNDIDDLGGHINDGGKVTTEATCTKAGVKTYTCTRCDEVLNTQTITALGHSYGEGEQTKAPTCEENGEMTYTCSRCGNTKHEDITATGHDLEHHDAVAETCTTNGNIAYSTCKNCGTYFNEEGAEITALSVVVAKHHTLTLHKAVAETCDTDGNIAYNTCDKCGKYFAADGKTEITASSVVIAKHHTLIYHDAQAATCTEKGWNAYEECSKCDYTTYEEISALGHDYGDWTVVTAATCTTSGKKEKVCSHDSTHKISETISPTGHSFGEWTTVTEATCTTDGLDERVCANDPSHKDTRVVEATGHEYGEWVVTLQPTCSAKGSKKKTCVNCSDVVTEEIAINPNAHSYGEWIPEVAANCTETGTKAHKDCTLCNKHFDSSNKEIADLTIATNDNHAWNDGVVTTAPTCKEKGVMTFTCTHNSAHTKTEDIAINPNAHSFGEWTTVSEATCTTDGSEERVCSYDNTHKETRTIEATGHTSVDVEAKDPTCTEKGHTAGTKCSVCGTVLSGIEEIAMVDHTLDAGVVTKEATCGATGIKTFTCTVCHTYTATEVIPATGNHTWDNGTITTAATVESDGVMTYECTVCHNTKEETIPKVLAYYVSVNGTATQLASGTNAGEYTQTVTLAIDDVVTLSSNYGDSYDFTAVSNFDGTATRSGEYTFTLTITESSYTVAVDVPEYAVTLEITRGNQVIKEALELNALNEDTRCDEYFIVTELLEGDTIAVVDNDGKTFNNYGVCSFKGTVTLSGEHGIYVKNWKVTVSEGNIWVNTPYYVYLSVNGGTPVILGYNEENTDPRYEEYFKVVTLKRDDTIRIYDSNGTDYNAYRSNYSFNGTPLLDGEYGFYVKLAKNEEVTTHVWVNVPTVRFYIDIANNPGVKDSNADLYIYTWYKAGGDYASWPGTKTQEITISGKTYYYADLYIDITTIKGLKIARVAPGSTTVWGQSGEIYSGFESGKLCIVIDGNFNLSLASNPE